MLFLLGGQKLKEEFSRMTKQVAECEKKIEQCRKTISSLQERIKELENAVAESVNNPVKRKRRKNRKFSGVKLSRLFATVSLI